MLARVRATKGHSQTKKSPGQGDAPEVDDRGLRIEDRGQILRSSILDSQSSTTTRLCLPSAPWSLILVAPPSRQADQISKNANGTRHALR